MTGASVIRPDRGYWAMAVTAAAVLVVACLAAAVTGVSGDLPHVWLFSTVAFTWLTLVWVSDGFLPHADRRLAVTVGTISVLAGSTAVALGSSPFEVLRTMVGVPLQAFVMALVYRAGRRALDAPTHPPLAGVGRWRNAWARGWAPLTSLDLALLAAGALVSGAVGLVVGAAPGVYLGNVSTDVALEWMVHVFVITTVGGATTLIAFGTWSPQELDQPWLRILGVWLASIAVLWWVYSTGTVTMAWLAVLPLIHVALTYRVWVTHTFGLLVGLASILLSPALGSVQAPTGAIPLGSVMDLLVSTLILVALLVAQLNQRRMQLLADLEVERSRARRQADILQEVFETMQDGVVLIDRKFDVRMHNRAAVTLLGREFPAERPASWTEYFTMARLDGTPLTEREMISSGYLSIRVGDGSRILRQTATKVTQDPDAGWIIHLTDITEHQARVAELSGFAGVVAHDLRSPLTSLEGWLELAEEAISARDPEQASALLVRARASNRRMREVIQDWLAYTVEREGELEVTTFTLADPVSTVVSQVFGNSSAHVRVDAPHQVTADLGLVRQLVANLVGNASKFVRTGEAPHVTITSEDAGGGWVRVSVADRGIGLPPGEEEKIFEDYHRGQEAASTREGFGMGLAACRRIVERHGGEISACTNAHGGATFTFTLPASAGGVPA